MTLPSSLSVSERRALACSGGEIAEGSFVPEHWCAGVRTTTGRLACLSLMEESGGVDSIDGAEYG